MEVRLKEIKGESFEHLGYGAGSGDVIKEEYECPCGTGIVFYEKDDIPGFRDTSIHCNCKDCDNKYEFRRGIAIKK